MGSRIKPSPSSLLVCWCEVVAGHGPNQPPWIIQKFPNTFDDQQMLNSIPQFVFPCKIEINAVQNFSFVLTALDSSFTFGFCRHSPQSESALVILSYLPWDSTFYKILHQCHELQTSDSPDDVWAFLQALLSVPVPDPGTDLTITYPPHNKMFVAKCYNHLGLPSIPDNRNLMEYMNAASSDTMLVVFASLLFERRILISSRNLQRLSSCIQAANALLFPMSWQHIYIPVMPQALLDYVLAPMPYLIGVPDVLMKMVHLDEVGEVVYLNADTDTIETPFNDLSEMPNEVVSTLRRCLNQPAQGMGDYVPRAFLKALVMLIGNYRDCLQLKQEERKVTFNMEKFVASRPMSMQPFVTKMLELQIFRQFLDERLELVNKGEATSDEFEMEVNLYSHKPRKNYQQFMHAVKNVKKEGGAIVKNFKSKASSSSSSKTAKANTSKAAQATFSSSKTAKTNSSKAAQGTVSSSKTKPSKFSRSKKKSWSKSEDEGADQPPKKFEESKTKHHSVFFTTTAAAAAAAANKRNRSVSMVNSPLSSTSSPSATNMGSESDASDSAEDTTTNLLHGSVDGALEGASDSGGGRLHRSYTAGGSLPPTSLINTYTDTVTRTRVDEQTNPAVKSAVKSVSKGGKQVKELSQEKYKEIRGKMKLPSNRSPEHTTYTNDREPRSAPSSPSTPRRLSHPLGGGGPVTAKASYTRNSVVRPPRSSQRDSSVPPSISASSFRSPDSPGHTPAPHTIDLVGELEQELFSRLSEPSSLSPRPSLTAPFTSTTCTTLPTTTTSSSQRSAGGRGDIPRPTALPPPIPNTRANTTLGTTRTREASPSRQTLSATSKDQDLILLGSPQEEEFDPLITKQLNAPSSLPPPLPSLDPLPPPRRQGAPNPVHSFLHSQPTPSSSSSSLLASIYQPYHPSYSSSSGPASSSSPSSLNTNDLSNHLSSGGQPLGIPTPAATSRPRSSLPMPPPPPVSSANDAAPSLPAPARRTSINSSSVNHRGFPAGQVLASRPVSTAAHGLDGVHGKAGNSIPSSTMAALPAALQHHLAGKMHNKNSRASAGYGSGRPLDSTAAVGSLPAPMHANRLHPATPAASAASVSATNMNSSAATVPARPASQHQNHRHKQVPPSNASVGGDHMPQVLKSKSVFDDPRFEPFSSLQATSSTPPSMQANPMYNMHQIPFPAKPNPGSTANTKAVNSIETNGKTPLPAASNKPNLALAFANSMLGSNNGGGGGGNDNNSSSNVTEQQPANNNTIQSKMLGPDLSESFAQMKLNKAAVAAAAAGGGTTGKAVDTGTASTGNRAWTAFE